MSKVLIPEFAELYNAINRELDRWEQEREPNDWGSYTLNYPVPIILPVFGGEELHHYFRIEREGIKKQIADIDRILHALQEEGIPTPEGETIRREFSLQSVEEYWQALHPTTQDSQRRPSALETAHARIRELEQEGDELRAEIEELKGDLSELIEKNNKAQGYKDLNRYNQIEAFGYLLMHLMDIGDPSEYKSARLEEFELLYSMISGKTLGTAKESAKKTRNDSSVRLPDRLPTDMKYQIVEEIERLCEAIREQRPKKTQPAPANPPTEEQNTPQ